MHANMPPIVIMQGRVCGKRSVVVLQGVAFFLFLSTEGFFRLWTGASLNITRAILMTLSQVSQSVFPYDVMCTSERKQHSTGPHKTQA